MNITPDDIAAASGAVGIVRDSSLTPDAQVDAVAKLFAAHRAKAAREASRDAAIARRVDRKWRASLAAAQNKAA